MISRILRILSVLAVIALPLSALAAKEPIYINLATNDPAKVSMALDAGRQYAEKGYPIVIYLNDKAVNLGVEVKSGNVSKEQEAIRQAIANGATIIVCPTCLEDYGFTLINLVQGVVLGAEHSNNR
ncbi:DsrE family protein [Polynucleobacter sp.]|jgi:predicted peroxiredoxin|uniref:DsrE family protein n=1 Tax=Polynucleobacter sp. TaxID=2029855 RepID=UPI0037CB85DB